MSEGNKIIRMANQIATFFHSQPADERPGGVATHINKFWEPRMRRLFFEIVDGGGDGLLPIVVEAAAQVRRPRAPLTAEQAAEANADVSG